MFFKCISLTNWYTLYAFVYCLTIYDHNLVIEFSNKISRVGVIGHNNASHINIKESKPEVW